MAAIKAHSKAKSNSKSRVKPKTKSVPLKSKDTKKVKHSSRPKEDNYKQGLLEVDKQEEKFDKLFEQKLAKQYREFRNLKEHHNQTKKFVRVFIVLMTIILITLLLMSF